MGIGQQGYSFKFQIPQQNPHGLSVGFYSFGETGNIACVSHWPWGKDSSSVMYFELRNHISTTIPRAFFCHHTVYYLNEFDLKIIHYFW